MKKKITISLGIALIIFSSMVLGLNTLVAQGAVLNAEILHYTPVPAEPGDTVTIYVLLTNQGSDPASDVQLEMANNYPFTVENVLDSIKKIPSIPGQESYLAKFKVRVDKNADEGTAYVKIAYTFKGSQGSKDQLLPLDIQTNEAAIGIKEINIVPETIYPGQQAKINIVLNNLANSRLRDIAVTLSTTKTAGTTTTTLPFVPIKGSLERRINELVADEEVTLSYDIVIKPEATSDVYSIPLTVTFSDESGNQYTINDEVGIIVNAKPMLSVYLESVGLYTEQPKGDVIVKFVNQGLAGIKLLTAEIGASQDFALLSNSRSVYIGNIDSDDYETSTFTIKANKNNFVIPVKIHYMDALNNEFNDEIQLQVNLFSEKDSGTKKSGTTTYVVLIIVLLIIIFVAYRIIRKRRMKKKLLKK